MTLKNCSIEDLGNARNTYRTIFNWYDKWIIFNLDPPPTRFYAKVCYYSYKLSWL